jgi:hypothetical protein
MNQSVEKSIFRGDGAAVLLSDIVIWCMEQHQRIGVSDTFCGPSRIEKKMEEIDKYY